MSPNKFKLFSAVDRCQPCRRLVIALDRDFPDWKNYIDYINADTMNEDEMELARKLNVFSLPSFTNSEKILMKGYGSDSSLTIKKLCLTKE